MRLRISPIVVASTVFLVGMVLRFALIDRQGLWADEAFSLAIATGHSLEHPATLASPDLGDYVEAPRPLPPSEYRRYLQHDSPPCTPGRVIRAVQLSDTNPPLYYLLLSYWTRAVGTSDLALRSFSILWGALCFPLVWSLARRLGGLPTAAAAVTLFAFAPLSVQFSVEGRMYTQLCFLTLLVAWLTLHLHRNGTSIPASLAWILASVFGLLTHYFFLFPWAGLVGWAVLATGRSSRAWTMASVVLVVLAVAPWYMRVPELAGNWRVTQGWLKERPANYDRRFALPKLAWSYVAPTGDLWGPRWHRGKLLANVLAAMAIAATIAMTRHRFLRRRRVVLLVFWPLSALLGPALLDVGSGTYLIQVPRYAISGMPAALLLLALALSHARARSGPILLAAIVLAWTPAYFRAWADESRHNNPTRELGRSVSGLAGEDDLLIVHSIPSGLAAVARYLSPDCGLERGAGMTTWVENLKVRHVPDDLERWARGRRRIYLIRVHTVGQPAPEEAWLRDNARLVDVRESGGGTMLQFEPRTGARFFELGSADPVPTAGAPPAGGTVARRR